MTPIVFLHTEGISVAGIGNSYVSYHDGDRDDDENDNNDDDDGSGIGAADM